jgi:hypothetical protein
MIQLRQATSNPRTRQAGRPRDPESVALHPPLYNLAITV